MLLRIRCSQQLPWSPTIDGVELTDYPWALAQAGAHANVSPRALTLSSLRNFSQLFFFFGCLLSFKADSKVPIIVGSNLDEGASFTHLKPQATASDFEAWITAEFGPYADMVRAAYPVSQYPPSACCSSYFYAADHISGDSSMTCPARRTARWFSRVQPDVYLYYFTRVPTGTFVAYHSCEIPFVFRALNLLNSGDDIAVSVEMSKLWNSFSEHGVPDGTAVHWPRYNNVTDLNLNINTHSMANAGLRKAQCDVWDTLLIRKCL